MKEHEAVKLIYQEYEKVSRKNTIPSERQGFRKIEIKMSELWERIKHGQDCETEIIKVCVSAFRFLVDLC